MRPLNGEQWIQTQAIVQPHVSNDHAYTQTKHNASAPTPSRTRCASAYLRMKPPLMAICSRSSTTRAPGWLFTTPSWFAPQAWPPPLILPHTHSSQLQQCAPPLPVSPYVYVCVGVCLHMFNRINVIVQNTVGLGGVRCSPPLMISPIKDSYKKK